MEKKLASGQLSQESHDEKVAALETKIADSCARISISTEMEAHAQSDLVVEAATERVDLKYKIFEQLSAWTPEHVILASNT